MDQKCEIFEELEDKLDEGDREDMYSFIEIEKRKKITDILKKDEDYKAMGVTILDHIKEGKEIPNNIYNKLILHKIKRTFDQKTIEEFIKEYFGRENYNPEE